MDETNPPTASGNSQPTVLYYLVERNRFVQLSPCTILKKRLCSVGHSGLNLDKRRNRGNCVCVERLAPNNSRLRRLRLFTKQIHQMKIYHRNLIETTTDSNDGVLRTFLIQIEFNSVKASGKINNAFHFTFIFSVHKNLAINIMGEIAAQFYKSFFACTVVSL